MAPDTDVDTAENAVRTNSLLDKIDLSEAIITEDEKSKLLEFLSEWKDVFAIGDLDVGLTSAVKHQIILNNTTPFKQRHRRIPPGVYTEVKQHLKQLLDSNIIRKSKSPWTSNIVLVRKKDKSLRLCVDFRQLSKRTINDAYALPRIEEILEGLGGNSYFSVLDMKSRYHQVEIQEEHKPYTAFTAGALGFYEYNRLHFGLSNSPAT